MNKKELKAWLRQLVIKKKGGEWGHAQAWALNKENDDENRKGVVEHAWSWAMKKEKAWTNKAYAQRMKNNRVRESCRGVGTKSTSTCTSKCDLIDWLNKGKGETLSFLGIRSSALHFFVTHGLHGPHRLVYRISYCYPRLVLLSIPLFLRLGFVHSIYLLRKDTFVRLTRYLGLPE